MTGGALALLILQQVFTFLKQRKNNGGNLGCLALVKETVLHTNTLTNKMFDMMDVKDPDGIPVWYVRRSLEKTLAKLEVGIQQQNTLIRELINEIRKK